MAVHFSGSSDHLNSHDCQLHRVEGAGYQEMKKIKSIPLQEGLKRQYAALPYRVRNGLEVLLISSRETHRWILPKGWPMKGRKPHMAAAQEALEEAGVVGKMGKEPVGSYRYTKRMKNGATHVCDVTVFPMKVDRQRKRWPEMDQRATRWFPIGEAAKLVGEPELQEVIRNFQATPSAHPEIVLDIPPPMPA